MLEALSGLGGLFGGGSKSASQGTQSTSVSNNLSLLLGEGNESNLSPSNTLDTTPIQTMREDKSLALSGTGMSQYRSDGGQNTSLMRSQPTSTGVQGLSMTNLIYLGVGILFASFLGLLFKKSK